MKFKSMVMGFSLLLIMPVAWGAGDPAAGEATAAVCAGCHMMDGNSVDAQYPKLAGQHEKYIVKQLEDIKSGKRDAPIMMPFASMLATQQDMENVAAYFARKTVTPSEADQSKLALGKAIYTGGNMGTGVPACKGCHSPDGTGNKPAGYPSIKGQHASYIVTQLQNFRDKKRENDPNGMMRGVAAHMSNAEIEAVANYIAQMK